MWIDHLRFYSTPPRFALYPQVLNQIEESKVSTLKVGFRPQAVDNFGDNSLSGDSTVERFRAGK